MKNLVFGLSAAVLTAAVLFGGGARLGAPGDVVPELLSVPLLYFVIGPGWSRLREAPLLKALVISVFGLVAIQLIPLPPSVWTLLPGRSPVSDMMSDAGIQPGWLGLSLRPYEALKVFLALLPPTALFFSVLVMDLKRRVWLIALLVCLGLLSVVVGLLQILNGSESPLYFYEFTSRNRAVGFFANPNHYTALLYATMPLAAALMAGASGRYYRLVAIAFVPVIFAFLVGLSISGSRTSLILGGLSLAASFALFLRSEAVVNLARRRLIFIAGVAALLFMPVLLGVGLLSILDRFDNGDLFDDLRWQVLPESFRQALAYFPVGSGLGVFEKAYALNEPVGFLIPAYINHVHNDLVELFYEAGVFGLIPAGLLIVVAMRLCVQALRTETMAASRLAGHLLTAAAIGAGLLLLHSLWDYPLRTEACLSVLAIFLATSVAPTHANIQSLVEAVPGVRRHRRRRSRPLANEAE